MIKEFRLWLMKMFGVHSPSKMFMITDDIRNKLKDIDNG